MDLSSIWRGRNPKVWEETVATIVHMSFHTYQEWLEVKGKGGNLALKLYTRAIDSFLANITK